MEFDYTVTTAKTFDEAVQNVQDVPPLLSLALASAAKIMAEAAVPATLTTSQAVLALPEWLLWKNSKEVFFQGLLNRVLHF